MNTPSEFHCRLIRTGLSLYMSDLTAEAKKVKALGFDAEAANLAAAAETIREHILPQYTEQLPLGAPVPGAGGPQRDIEEEIREIEREMKAERKAKAAGGPDTIQPQRLALAAGEEPADALPDTGCLQCGKEIPEERGGDFCSDVCQARFVKGVAEQEGVAIEPDPPAELTGLDDPLVGDHPDVPPPGWPDAWPDEPSGIPL